MNIANIPSIAIAVTEIVIQMTTKEIVPNALKPLQNILIPYSSSSRSRCISAVVVSGNVATKAFALSSLVNSLYRGLLLGSTDLHTTKYLII